MPNLQHTIEQRLQNLIINKDRELTDLIEDLGYEYDNESYLFITSQWSENQKYIVNNITRLGYYDDDFHIFWVQLNSVKLNKSDQRTLINLINRKFPYNLCIFSNSDDTIWDFVNIKAVKSEESDDDKEPKKRQYLRRIRIDQGERLRTAVERISLLKVPEAGIHHFELQQRHDDAFDVEAVTDQFFDDFTKVFSNFRKHLAELSNDGDWAHAYGLQFFNRLIFVYFIQKKRWLGDDSEFIQSYWESYLKAQQT
ncbi:MAG: hypothetical protein H8E60_10295 [Candidatus Marinimicrobia bacterium]|nr:hypothetical protein [Candidatus Neomarinimicrobiota bacterium]